MRQGTTHPVPTIFEIAEQFRHAGMFHRAALCIAQQVLLANISYVGRFLVFGEEVVIRLFTLRSNVFRDRFVPFLAIGENWVDIENHPAEIECTVAHDIADVEAGISMARHINGASGGLRKELDTFHRRGI
jgi:hypothetical protein